MVLAMSDAGYPVVRAEPDLTVQHGANSNVRQGDVVHKLNGAYTEGCSFRSTVDKLLMVRPLTIEFVRPTTSELRSRFYGTATSERFGSMTSDGGSGKKVSSRKKKAKMKKKIRR